MTLTPKQIQNYIESEGYHCPYCTSDNINSDMITIGDDDRPFAFVECLSCKMGWNDIYKLNSIEEIDEVEA